MTRALGGILAPVTTPFVAGSEALDLDGFAANLTAHLADGLDGIVVAGSTGEAALLDEAERTALAAAAREVARRTGSSSSAPAPSRRGSAWRGVIRRGTPGPTPSSWSRRITTRTR